MGFASPFRKVTQFQWPPNKWQVAFCSVSLISPHLTAWVGWLGGISCIAGQRGGEGSGCALYPRTWEGMGLSGLFGAGEQVG